jgi:hypothetical protein
MKKILIHAAIRPNDTAVTVEDIKKCLSQLGCVNFSFAEEFSIKDASELTNSVWLYDNGDESSPLLVVNNSKNDEGQPISEELLAYLLEHGACSELCGLYPRADRYGTPEFSNNDDIAAALASDYGFKVAVDFESYAEDFGDDTSCRIWLKIAYPENRPTYNTVA